MEAVAELTSPLDQYAKKFTPPIHILERDDKEGYIKFQHPLGSGVTKEVVELREDGSLTIIGIDLTSGMKTTLEIRGNLDLEYWQGVLYMIDDKSWEDCLKHLPIAFSAEDSKTIE